MTELKRVSFAPNIPQQLALKDPDALIVDDWTYLYETTDGRGLYVNKDVAVKINMLDLRIGEAFHVCKRWNGERGQAVRWDVWRSGDGEKQRAAEERSEIEEQLRESIHVAQQRKQLNGGNNGTGAAPHHKHGAVPSAVKPSPGRDTENNNGTRPTLQRFQSTPPTQGANCQEAASHDSNTGNYRVKAASNPTAAEQPAMVHFPWCQFLLSQTNALADVYAAALSYSSARHGNAVKPEDLRTIMVTAFINLRQQGGANAA